MRKKLLTFLFSVFLACTFGFTLTACSNDSGKHDHVFDTVWSSNGTSHYHACTVKGCSEKEDVENHTWDNGTVAIRPTKLQDGQKKFTCTICQREKTETIAFTAPTSTQVYSARQTVVAEQYEGYNFIFAMEGNFSVLGLSASLNGFYEGEYRLNKTTGEEQFKRTSSGELFFDGTAYSYTKNSQKIKLVADETGIIKKSSVIRTQDEDSFFINKTVVGLVNIINSSIINNIQVADTSVPYDFASTLNFGANVQYLSKITSLFSNFGTKVAFKNVEFTNPTAIPFFFSIDENNRLEDFCLGLQISIKIKGITTTISVSYAQQGATSAIQIPQVSDLIVDNSQIQTELNKINSAINTVKNSDTYSLDVVARNELDPAWNKLAIVDQYKARLYKNKVQDNVWFNHSYEYKAHHESDGAETYKYTLGNIENGETYLVSRKGGNTINAIENVSASTQFDYLTNPFIFSVSEIDCIKKVVDETTTTYVLHLGNQSAISVQDKILDIVNSNNAEGVVEVNNYINQNINVKDAEFTIVFENNVLKEISIKTDLKYNPTAGDYTDYNVSLTNKLELKINENFDKAEDYTAPSKAESNIFGLGGLESFTYYIL